MSIADYSIVNITHLSIQRSSITLGYIDIHNSVTLYIANSQMTSYHFFIFPNGFFVLQEITVLFTSAIPYLVMVNRIG